MGSSWSATAGTAAALTLLCLAGARPADAGSAFSLRGEARSVVAENHDWHFGDGILFVNPRGRSRASVIRGSEHPTVWVARHGSVTFNQYGRGLPSGGINEAGLVVDLLWHDAARYPPPDDRSELGSLEWIQYQLDSSDDVAGVLASDESVRIRSGVPLHFLVADRTGRVAVIEFLDGRLVVRDGAELPEPVLTDDGYAESLEHLRRLDRRGAIAGDGNDSPSRFVRAARELREPPGPGAAVVDRAFAILAEITQGRFTQWSVVYEPVAARLHFRTLRQPQPRLLDLAQIDFACSGPTLTLDLNADVAGEVAADLRPLTDELEPELSRASARASVLADRRLDELERLARLAGTDRCAE